MNSEDNIRKLEQTRKAIIEFTNQLEEKLRTKQIGGIEYHSLINQKLDGKTKEELIKHINKKIQQEKEKQKEKQRKTKIIISATTIIIIIALLITLSITPTQTPTGLVTGSKQKTETNEEPEIKVKTPKAESKQQQKEPTKADLLKMIQELKEENKELKSIKKEVTNWNKDNLGA